MTPALEDDHDNKVTMYRMPPVCACYHMCRLPSHVRDKGFSRDSAEMVTGTTNVE